nr:MAG TPA: hypothetical protein [Caudoviricetes sp.]
MSIKINSYFCDNGKSDIKGSPFTIIDKLIRITAKITENYASDIFYDIKGYDSWIYAKNNHEVVKDFHTIFFFRENGVSVYNMKGSFPVPYNAQFEAIQTWELYHSVNEDYGILRRVSFKSSED